MNNSENEENLTENKKGSNMKNVANKVAEKGKKEVAKKVTSSAAKKSIIAAAGPAIAIAAIVLFAVVVITGIAVFLNTLPGMAMENLKKLGKKMANGLASWFGQDSSTQVDETLIYTTLDYLCEMGYDIKGYGFITKSMTSGDAGSNEYLDDDSGVIRNKDTDKITKAESDFVMAYLVSDNYIYTLANDNLVVDSGGGFFGWLLGKITALGRHFIDFFGGSLGENWTSGLVTLWYEDGEVGHRGDFYSDSGFFNHDDVWLDPDKKVLHIKRGWGGSNTKYKLDGWTGRYGMPMEFLLSIHLATMMPDLSYDMADTFETKLNIILHPINGSYVPYIENVINHWYRNVYFTNTSYNKDNEADGRTLSFVDYDYGYESVMKERWTLYETDDNGDYILFVLSDKLDGEYATSSADIDGYNSSKIESKDGFYIYKGTRDDAAKENVNVAKKAVMRSSSDSSYLEDMNWNEYGGVWTAYKKIDNLNEDIVQKGEAQRGETNAEIKKMFLENTYFRYDGNTDTADAIMALRKEYGVKYGAIDKTFDVEHDDLSRKKVSIETSSGRKTYSIKDVSGKVTLNQDSLNSFSMLENTKTLDADYIYKDFKELIVELGYFEKEELTDETPRLLAWIIPDVGSRGYPKRGLDKIENEFGTMIHSEGDQNAYDKAVLWNDTTTTPIEHGEDGSADAEQRVNTASVSVINTNIIQSVAGKKRKLLSNGSITNDFKAAGWDDVDLIVRSWAEKFRYTTAENYYHQYNEEEYIEWLETLGGVFEEYAGQDKQGAGDGNSFIDAEKYVYGLMWIAGFEYCAGTCLDPAEYYRCDPLMDATHEAGFPPGNTLWPDVFEWPDDPQPANKYDAFYGYPGVGHSHIDCEGGPLGIHTTYIDDAMLEYDFTTCCNITTDKVFYKAGLFGDGSDKRPTSSCDYKGLIKNYGAKVITEVKDLHMGDIIQCFTVDNHTNPDPNSWSGWEHVLFVGEETEDTVTLYTTGHDFTNTGDFRRVLDRDASRDVVGFDGWIGLHIWDLETPNNKYNGYAGNEAVVSPVTGVLLEYGTYANSDNERINVDLLYDNYLADILSSGGSIDYAISRQEYKEQVGYAKILVLDNENYKKLESGMSNKWRSNSLLEKLEGSGTYRYRDEIKTVSEVNSLSAQDRTVYGYKEFVEKYEQYGIAGNIIYIDGFKCERPDPGFNTGSSAYPNGEKITMSDFKVSPGELGKKEEQGKSRYHRDALHYTVSQKIEDKLEAEAEVKRLASPSVTANGLVFIKEGTVIGRTVTDKELIEVDRGNSLGSYSELRESNSRDKYRVIGNYIRMIMRDKQTDTVAENIEDYMILDTKEVGDDPIASN